MSILVGLLLSDGCLRFQTGCKNASFKFVQGFIHKEYCWYVFTILAHYCSSLPYVDSCMVGGQLFYALRFETRAYPVSPYYMPNGIKGVKIIPDIIYDLLTPLALAHWACGDGSLHGPGFRFATESFSVQECVLLMNVLRIVIIWTVSYTNTKETL